MRQHLYLLTPALLLFLTTTPCTAQPAGGGYGRGRMLSELGLNAEQTEQLACEEPGRGMQLRVEYDRERKILNDLLRDRSVPDQGINDQLEKVNSSFAEWNRFRLSRMLKARSVLTAEQMEKLLKIQEEGGGFRHGRGRWAAEAQ